MLIQTEATPDPAKLKFLPDQEVLPKGTLDIRDKTAAAQSPLAKRLFKIDGIIALSFGKDHITVTKNKGEWSDLRPDILSAIMDHYMSGDPILFEAAQMSGATANPSESLKTLTGIAANIREALRMVIDPELGYNIVDLGLIYEIAIENGSDVVITMTTTTKGCPATNYLKQGSNDAAWSIDGVEAVDVQLTYDPEWTPSMMSPEAKDYFGITD